MSSWLVAVYNSFVYLQFESNFINITFDWFGYDLIFDLIRMDWIGFDPSLIKVQFTFFKLAFVTIYGKFIN